MCRDGSFQGVSLGGRRKWPFVRGVHSFELKEDPSVGLGDMADSRDSVSCQPPVHDKTKA